MLQLHAASLWRLSNASVSAYGDSEAVATPDEWIAVVVADNVRVVGSLSKCCVPLHHIFIDLLGVFLFRSSLSAQTERPVKLKHR